MSLVVYDASNPYNDTNELKRQSHRHYRLGENLVIIEQRWKKDGLGGSALGFGASVYDAAFVLADYVCEHVSIGGKRVVELGTGTGMVAVQAAIQVPMAAEVVATDGDEELLELTMRNLQSNMDRLLVEKSGGDAGGGEGGEGGGGCGGGGSGGGSGGGGGGGGSGGGGGGGGGRGGDEGTATNQQFVGAAGAAAVGDGVESSAAAGEPDPPNVSPSGAAYPNTDVIDPAAARGGLAATSTAEPRPLDRVRTAPLYWGNTEHEAALAPPFDVVLVADCSACVYEEAFSALVGSMVVMSGPGTLVLLSYHRRVPAVEAKFFHLLKRKFVVVEVERERIHRDFRKMEEVSVFELRLKDSR